MKIGILTYHRVVNDGAVFQAACLHKLLQERFEGHRVELINYAPWMVVLREYARCIKRRYPYLNPPHWRKMRTLRAFHRQNIPTSSASCVTDDLGRATQFIRSQQYDAVVVGSDTVWEVRPGGGSPLPPNIYYLPGMDELCRISFAASTDKTHLDLLDVDDRRQKLRKCVEDFDLVTVRDNTARSFVESLGVDPGHVNYMPDPTVVGSIEGLVDASYRFDKGGKPLAGVTVTGQRGREISEMLQRHGYRVLRLLGRPNANEIATPNHLSVPQRIGMLRDLDLLISERFHTSIFTLKQSHAPVIFVESAERYPPSQQQGARPVQPPVHAAHGLV